MAGIVKILTSEINCNTTPNTFNFGKVVRIAETGGVAVAFVTMKDANAATLATITVLPKTDILLQKRPTDTLQSNSATCVGVSVAFTDD